jgi:hypothetical protein
LDWLPPGEPRPTIHYVTQAVRDAKSMPRPSAQDNTSEPTARRTVPNYGADSSSMSNLYQNGNGNLVGNGQTRVAGCQNQGDPECQAVQTVKDGKSTRPQFTINKNDPMLQNASDTRNNAGTIIGGTPGGQGQPTQQCTTTTTTSPGTTFDETCDIATPASLQTCQVVRDIVVDRDANYQCDTIGSQLQTYTCNRTLNVSVTYTDSCKINSVTTVVPEIGSTMTSVSCDATLNALFDLQISTAYQCHGGTCNSNYFPVQIRLTKGVPSSGTTQLGGDYRCGGTPCYITFSWSYDGAGAVSVTELGDSGLFGAPTVGGTGYLLPGVCPGGFTYQAFSDGTWNCGAPSVGGVCSAGSPYTSCDAAGNCAVVCQAAFSRHGLDYIIDGGRTSVPNVTQSWIDGCATLEARR